MFGLGLVGGGLSRSGRRAIASFGTRLAEQPVVWQWADKNISLGSVVRWQDFGRSNPLVQPRRSDYEFMGFAAHGREYSGTRVTIPQLEHIVRHELVEDFECNLTDIEGLGASKAPLDQLADMDAFANERCTNYIQDLSLAAMNKSLSHGEIRVLHRPGSDFFVRHSWDGRLFLANSGGSHHLCSARYVAVRLKARVPLRAALHQYEFDQAALDDVLSEYGFGVIDPSPVLATTFVDAMRTAKTRFYWFRLPQPYDQLRGVIFPLEEERSRQAFDLLQSMGMFDLGAYLKSMSTTNEHIS